MPLTLVGGAEYTCIPAAAWKPRRYEPKIGQPARSPLIEPEGELHGFGWVEPSTPELHEALAHGGPEVLVVLDEVVLGLSAAMRS